MNVERQLQICMAALAALGTLLLGLGQRDAWLPVVAAGAAVASVYIVDIRHWFSLNRNLANVAALIAVVLSVWEFRKAASDEQLLAIANLLIYLQLVLMFQIKTDRVYWQLVVLSLLQVVVAAALNLGFEFGVLLFVYLVVAMTSLFLFFVRRETRLLDEAEQEDLNEWWAFGTPVRDESDDAERSPGEAAGDEPNGFHSADAFAQVALPDAPDETSARPLPGWSMLREVLSLSAITLVFAAVLFYSVPRSADGQQRGLGRTGSVVGFNPDSVKLDERQRISSDDRTALRISLWDHQTGESLILPEPLYLRGVILTQYQGGAHGEWRNIENRSGRRPASATGRPLIRAPTSHVVRQEITIDRPDHNILVAIYPAFDAPQSDDRVRYFPPPYSPALSGNSPSNWRAQQVVPFALHEQLLGKDLPHEQEGRRPSSYDYTVTTTNIRNRQQNRFTALSAMESEPRWPAGLTDFERTHLLRYPRPALPQLSALAAEIVNGIPEEKRLERCQVLERHFRYSNLYRYSLDLDTLPAKSQLDPVEHFVAEHRTGNCEFFAAALTLMLRSQGIESRMVIGFKGGEYNAVGRYYVVKQRDAHAWVEAYIPFDELPADALSEGESREGGAWYRLDPTPDAEEFALGHLDQGPFAWVGQSLDYAQVIWNDYVVTLNSERQQEAIFRPLLERTAGTLEKAFQAETWRSIFAAVAGALGLAPDGWFVTYWYLWLGLVIVPLSLLGAWLAWLFVGPLTRLLFTGHWTDPSVKGPTASRVPFYARLEQLLAATGLVRERGQTPHEFVQALAANLAEVPFLRDAVPLVRQVTEAYYRVRFGSEQLSWDERAEIERDLLVLQRVLGAQLAPSS